MCITSSEGNPPVRPYVRIPLLAAALLLAGCGLLPSTGDACPETVIDRDGGTTDGMDLALPDWLPPDFPIPAGTSIRHVNDGTPAGTRLITGFIPGGDAAETIAFVRSALASAGYQTLLEAAGFVPIGNPVLAALDPDPGLIVWLDIAVQQAAVRSGDECPLEDGLLIGLRFEPTDAGEARARFTGSSLTRGTATAAIGGDEFAAAGECLVLDGAYTFTATSGEQVGLQFDTATNPPLGWASADSENAAAFNLATDHATPPEFAVTGSGFSATGMFIDGFGDTGIVAGRVDTVCSW